MRSFSGLLRAGPFSEPFRTRAHVHSSLYMTRILISGAGIAGPRTGFGIFVRDQVLRLSALPFVADWLMRRFIADDFELPVYATAGSVTA